MVIAQAQDTEKTNEKIVSKIETIISDSEKGMESLQQKIQAGTEISKADMELFQTMELNILNLRKSIEAEGGEASLPDDLRIKLHQIEEAAKQTNQQTQETAKTLEAYQGTIREKIQQYAKDNPGKTLAGAGVFTYCFATEVAKKKTRLGRAWGAVVGTAKGAFYGGLTMLGIDMVDKVYEWGKEKYNMIIHPVETLKKGIAWLGDSIGSLKDWILGKKNTYDPRNQDVHENRQDTNIEQDGNQPAAIYIDEQSGNIMGKRQSGETKRVMYHGDIALLPSDAQKKSVDALYNSLNLTGKYMLYVKAMNMMCHAARKKVQSSGKLNLLPSIGLREQEILETQKILFQGVDLQGNGKQLTGKELEDRMMQHLKNVTDNMEGYFDGIIGKGDWSDVIKEISYFDAKNDYNTSYSTTELKVFELMRATGGQGDSDVVLNQLTQEIMKSEKMSHLLDFMDESKYPEILELLRATRNGTSGQKEKLIETITKHLKGNHFMQESGIAGLQESQISGIVEKMVLSYNTLAYQLEDQSDKAGVLKQMKANLEQAYGDIDHNQQAQQKMVDSYVKQYGEEAIKNHAQQSPISGKTFESNKYDYVQSFAFTIMKEGAIKTSIMTSFQSEFLYNYLPTQKTAKEGTDSESGMPTTYYEYENGYMKKYDDIVGLDGMSDKMTAAALNVAINVGLCLIPGLGAELVLARVGLQLARLGKVAGTLARVLVAGATGHLLQTTMNAAIYHKGFDGRWQEFSDLRTAGNNMLLYGTLGRLGEILKIVPGLGTIGKAATKVLPDKLQPFATHWLAQSLGMAAATTSVVEMGRSFFDPQYEWNWKEVITIFMLTLALEGGMKGYKAVKDARGKPMLVKNNLQQKLDMASYTKTQRAKLDVLKAGEETEIHGVKIRKTESGSYEMFDGSKWNTVPWKNKTNVVFSAFKQKYGSLTSENAIKALADDMEGAIDDLVTQGKQFRLGDAEYKFVNTENGGISLAKKNITGFKALSDAELKAVLEGHQQVMATRAEQIAQKFSESKEKISDIAGKLGDQKNAFMDFCKQEGLNGREKRTVGDFFKKIGEKKRGQLFINPTRGYQPRNFIIGNKILKPARFILNQDKNIFNLLAAGMDGFGADGEGGIIHGGSTYLAYTAMRTWPGKLLLALLDSQI